MKYVVIERLVDGRINYYGTFYTERSALTFIAGTVKREHATYEISEIYSSTELTHHNNSVILDNQEGTS